MSGRAPGKESVKVYIYKGVILVYKSRSKAAMAFLDLNIPVDDVTFECVHLDEKHQTGDELDRLLAYKHNYLYAT